MKIICHRGFWEKKAAQNSLSAIEDAMAFGGAEVDLKHHRGELVLSHDPIVPRKRYLPLKVAFQFTSCMPNFFWALNIKEDGLGPILEKLIDKYKPSYRCFDLSTPELVIFKEKKLKVFERVGDRDFNSNIRSSNLVFDCFKSRNISLEIKKLKKRCNVFFISPELHGENPIRGWCKIKNYCDKNNGDYWICTDYPIQAKRYFNGE